MSINHLKRRSSILAINRTQKSCHVTERDYIFGAWPGLGKELSISKKWALWICSKIETG